MVDKIWNWFLNTPAEFRLLLILIGIGLLYIQFKGLTSYNKKQGVYFE